MSWVERLSIELIARGVPRRERAQIVLELEDHIACEQGCEERLGDPRELATGFAEQLATSRARVTAFRAFWALALAAVALALSQLAIGHAGGYRGFTSGLSLILFVPALLGLFVAPQVALVAGSLAALRAVRRRHARSLPAAEVELIERRTRVALLAGLGTVAGLGCYALDFVLVLPGWYLVLIGGSAAVAGAALLSAMGGVRAAEAIVSQNPGPPGDVYDDLPVPGRRWLRRHPWWLGVIGSVGLAMIATFGQAHAERSLSEGLQRGTLEGLIALIGYALLGSAIGLFTRRSGTSDAP
jgi:hypothetical protein